MTSSVPKMLQTTMVCAIEICRIATVHKCGYLKELIMFSLLLEKRTFLRRCWCRAVPSPWSQLLPWLGSWTWRGKLAPDASLPKTSGWTRHRCWIPPKEVKWKAKH
jgi:hypothetical protein